MYVHMTYVRMIICMYVYMHVYMYMDVCAYVWMYVCAFVCMYICLKIYLYVCIYVCMYFCMYEYFYICMYVHIYEYMYICMHKRLLLFRKCRPRVLSTALQWYRPSMRFSRIQERSSSIHAFISFISSCVAYQLNLWKLNNSSKCIERVISNCGQSL